MPEHISLKKLSAELTVCGDPHVTPASIDKAAILFDIFEDIGNDVIILGDLFEFKEIVRGQCMNFVMDKIKRSKLHYIILVGNHDWFNLDCKDHSLRPLKELPNVTIVDKPMAMNLDSRAALFLPYFDNIEALKKELQEAEAGGTDFVFMHQGVVGFDYGNGHMADGNGHGEMTADIVSGFLRVISGHFHKYAEEGNLTFLGTPYSHTFGETDQTKYLAVLRPHENEFELIETPFPRHRTLNIDLSKKSAIANLKKVLKDSKDEFRVILTGTEMQIKAVDQKEFSSVKFLEDATDSGQVEDVKLSETDSNEKKFLTWAKDIKQLDEETIALGLELLSNNVIKG